MNNDFMVPKRQRGWRMSSWDIACFFLRPYTLDCHLRITKQCKGMLQTMLQTFLQGIYDVWYASHIDRTGIPFMLWPRLNTEKQMSQEVVFPAPRGININMMPIRLGNGLFNSLPEDCRQYTKFICTHCFHGLGKNSVGYLTIQEGVVPVGQSQRRPGLHIERPGSINAGGTWNACDSQAFAEMAWGLGLADEDGLPDDGIFMASTVDDSCAIWPVLIKNPSDVSDKHGEIAKMRHLLGEPYNLRANEMCWFTDRTPHESLPLQPPASEPDAKFVHRQFFRLVVGPISVWYSKHNTENPLGIQPDAPISDEDKFS